MMLTGVVLFALGIAVIIFQGGAATYNRIRSQTMLSTSGIVANSAVIVEQGDPKYPGYHYRARVAYQYTIANHQLKGMHVYFGCCIGGHARQQAIVQRYRFGCSLAVYYDLQNPGDSLLVRGWHSEVPSTWYLVGMDIMLVGMLCLKRLKRTGFI